MVDILKAKIPGMTKEAAITNDSVQEDSVTTLGRNSCLTESTQTVISQSEATKATNTHNFARSPQKEVKRLLKKASLRK